eukprot:m.234635 g.234635  ORF g.234635 m.234635 type:complete len:80 (+) comp19698_c0_seq1:382-621(+)
MRYPVTRADSARCMVCFIPSFSIVSLASARLSSLPIFSHFLFVFVVACENQASFAFTLPSTLCTFSPPLSLSTDSLSSR